MQFMRQGVQYDMFGGFGFGRGPLPDPRGAYLGVRVRTVARLAAATFYFFLAAAPRTSALLNAHVGARRVSSARPYGCVGLVPSWQLGFILHR
jgi:hypothetical protein